MNVNVTGQPAAAGRGSRAFDGRGNLPARRVQRRQRDTNSFQRFTRLRQDRQGLALQEKANGERVFLEGNALRRDPSNRGNAAIFPNLWNFPGFEKVCRAIPREVGARGI